MTGILGASIAQNTTVSVTKSVEINHEQSVAALSARAYAGSGRAEADDPFSKVFDVVDISEDAQRKLREDREFALQLASLVKGRHGVDTDKAPLLKRGSLRVDAGAVAVQEKISVTESFEVSILNESTVTLQTTDGDVEISHSRLLEASYSRSLEYSKSAAAAYVKGSLST
ncbi:MAG: hypothetical protein JKY71_10410 [Alphaproteobacteria bacterium]|nr:hypothetical protein [Alphaproteobacteria bacterium]